MKARELMTREVLFCSADDTLFDAARRMWESDVGCLVVIDSERRPIGMVTDRDIAMAAYTQGRPLRESSVASAMSRTISTCSPETPLVEVERTMRDAQIRRVPVVDSHGELCGIVTLGDLARAAKSKPWGLPGVAGLVRTLAAIIEKRSQGQSAKGRRSWRALLQYR